MSAAAPNEMTEEKPMPRAAAGRAVSPIHLRSPRVQLKWLINRVLIHRVDLDSQLFRFGSFFVALCSIGVRQLVSFLKQFLEFRFKLFFL